MQNAIYKVDHRYNTNPHSRTPTSAPLSYRAQIEQMLERRTPAATTEKKGQVQERCLRTEKIKPMDIQSDEFDRIMEEDLAHQLKLLEVQETKQKTCPSTRSPLEQSQGATKTVTVEQKAKVDDDHGNTEGQQNKVMMNIFLSNRIAMGSSFYVGAT